jgi:ankyrin repeat protein
MKGDDSISLLMKAAYYGSWELTAYLVGKNAWLADVDRYNRTALIHACMNERDNYEVVGFLLDAGAVVDHVDW